MMMKDSGHAIWWALLIILAADSVQTQDSTECGGHLSQQSGVITSPHYPDNYPNYMNCYWTITAGDKELIDLRFSRLDLDGTVSDIQWVGSTCPDYVRVYDGDSVSSPLIVTMCRIMTQSELAKIIIRSTKNKLHIVFASDYQGQRPGFVASYWTHECPEFTYGSETCNRTCECNIENTASCNNTNGDCKCKNEWTSRDCSEDVNECLNPKVEPCPFNYMECVNTIGGFECVCKAGLTENNNGECEVQSTAICKEENGCSHMCVNISTEGQTMEPHCYCPDNMKLVGDSCEACSNVAFGKDCRLSCQCIIDNTESCDITTGECICSQGWTLSDCSKDIDECTELRDTVCVHSEEQCVNTLGGYQCNCRSGYERSSNGSCVLLGCSYTLTNSSGVIQSPNYPNEAYDDMSCTWTIATKDEGATISLNFTELIVGYDDQYRDYCYWGALEVYDGKDSSALLLARYCGYYSYTGNVRSSGDTLHLVFRTARYYNKRFIGTYSTQVYQVFTSKITDPSGTIISPGYPAGYTSNVFAAWTITVDYGNVVTLSFSDSGLGECGRDYMEVFDGSHPGATRISQFCGSSLPRKISSTEKSMHIIYSSEGNTSEKGFNGSYVTDACKCNQYYTASCNSPTGPCVCKSGYTGSSCDNDIDECQSNPCPDHSTCINSWGSYYCYCWNGTQITPTSDCKDWSKVLTDQTGDIQSQGYPNFYPSNVNYSWTVIGKPNTVISLRFSDFDVETVGACYYTDLVEVYDGISGNNRLIGQYCGKNIPGLLRTTDKSMYIIFRTDRYDRYRNYKGFKGTYYSHVCPLFTYGEETCSNPCSCAYDTTRICDNTNGVCFCKTGWVGRGCSQDLDECLNQGVCPSNSDCINEAGTYTCQCHSGYVKDITTGQCEESSHCSIEMKQKCSHLCDVDQATQKEMCFCPADLVLLNDNVTCVVSLYPYGTEASDSEAYGKTNTGIAQFARPFQFSSLVPFGSHQQTVGYVLYNGVIAFNTAKITGIPDMKTAQAANHKLIAPFWTEQKKSGEGEVFYHVYEKCGSSIFSETESASSPKAKDVFARAVRDIIKFHSLSDFEVNLVLVATWKDVQPKDCTGNFTNIFQAILVSGYIPYTDQNYLQAEEQSYAIFIYKDGDGICKPGQPFEVGVVSDSVINVLQIDKNATKLKDFNGNTGYKGVVTFEAGKQHSASLMCQRYLCNHADLISNQHFQSEIQELYQCPCSLDRLGLQWQFLKDEGNTKCFAISAVAKRRLLRNNQRNRLCCYSWITPKSDSWEDWHESWMAGSFIPSGHILLSDPWPWSSSFDNLFTYKNAEENMQAATWCCQKSPYKFCNRFYKIFGDLQCSRNPTFVPASALGDPYMMTLDRHRYPMNFMGEIVMIDIPSTNFTLQARTQRIVINGILSRGTVFTAFAALEGNYARFQIQLDTTNTSMILLSNGMDYTRKFYEDVNFSWSSSSISIIRRNENNKITVAVTFPCGVSIKVHVGFKSLEIDLEVDSSQKNMTRGLLGNFDDDPNNDYILPNGTVLSPDSSERQIFEQFVKAYVVTDDTSAFIYEAGESTKDYQHPEYVPLFLDESDPHQLSEARAFCGNNTIACVLDYIATGNKDFAENTKDEIEIIDLMRQRLDNNPPIIRLVTTLDTNNHWLVYEKKQNSVRFEATDDDKDEVTFELVGDIKDVLLDQNGTVTYTPDLQTPNSLLIRAKDSKGAYSPILTLIIVVCSLCNNHGDCNVNTVAAEFLEGHYQILKCNCHPAYTGENCESELDACELSPCTIGQECTDLAVAEQGNRSIGYKCGLCPTGTTNVHGSCEDINECLDSTVCDHDCLDTYRSYQCSCRPGFRLELTDSRTCNDINECMERTAACQQECINTFGSYTCACKSGYTLSSDGTCTIDASISAVCQQCEQVCTVNNSQVSCDCNLGYKINDNDPTKCSDVDECSYSPCSQICTNTRGKFECSCHSGYKLDIDAVTCLECDSNHFGDNCSGICDCRGQGTCDRVLGCICDTHWSGINCDKDVNECTDSHACADGMMCVNEPGSFKCVCHDGYRMEKGACQDIDECLEYTNRCDLKLEDCYNNLGNYSCRCKKGFKHNEATDVCEDVNECEHHTDGCKHFCENGPGSYKCACNQGYRLAADRHSCEKYRNVCSLDCSHDCSIDKSGTSFCICPRGYHKVGSNACEDINECASADENPCDHKDRCINTDGNYICSCEPGYRLENDGKSCLTCSSGTWGVECNNSCSCGKEAISCDPVMGCQCKPGCTGEYCTDVIDRCASGEVTCQPNEECVISGCSSVCQCRKGFVWVIDQCKDENECLSTGRHNCEQICTNTEGSFVCSCYTGYKYNSSSNACQDENECLDLKLHNCDQVCTNTKEGFICSCYLGYNYNSSTNTCHDENECQITGQHNCDQVCTNTDGSFVCSCSPGYYLNSTAKTCQDENECQITGRHNCDQVCTNTEGSFVCSCYPGYHLNPKSKRCEDENECQITGRHNCDQVCTNTDGSFICSCSPGYYLNSSSKICQDENECQITGRNNCDQVCTNTEGSFVCSCYPGYHLNSKSKRCEDENECLNTERHNCDQNCTNTVGSFACSCYPGYYYNSSSKTCQDVNECQQGEPCSQTCINTDGSYRCVCQSGQFLLSDGVTCGRCPNGCPITCNCVINNTQNCDKTIGQCNCKDGWTSDDCSVDIDECLQHPCPDYRKCRNLNGSFECVCWNELQISSNGTCVDCNRTLTDRTGYLMSPNYPQLYPSNSYCSWTISVNEPDIIIVLRFLDFDVEGCPYDHVRIYNGVNRQAPILDRVCENWQKPLTSKGNNLHIVFTSDYTVNKKGFFASYSSYLPCKSTTCSHSCSVVSSNPRMEKCQCPEWMKLDKANDVKCVNINACNTTITKSEGYIVSSNYPEPYPFNFNCHWVIQGSHNSTVKLSLSDFKLETSFRCRYDYLTIHDGNSETAPLIGHFCGNTLPPNITSSGNTLYIKFKSDGFLSYRGFKGRYTIHEK